MHVQDISGGDQGSEEVHGGVEAVMKCFEEDGSVRQRELGKVKEDLCFGGVGDGWFLEQDVLAGADGADGPFEV